MQETKMASRFISQLLITGWNRETMPVEKFIKVVLPEFSLAYIIKI